MNNVPVHQIGHDETPAELSLAARPLNLRELAEFVHHLAADVEFIATNLDGDVYGGITRLQMIEVLKCLPLQTCKICEKNHGLVVETSAPDNRAHDDEREPWFSAALAAYHQYLSDKGLTDTADRFHAFTTAWLRRPIITDDMIEHEAAIYAPARSKENRAYAAGMKRLRGILSPYSENA